MPPCAECDTLMRKRWGAAPRGPDPDAGPAHAVMIRSSAQQDATHACLREPPGPACPVRTSNGIPRPRRSHAGDPRNADPSGNVARAVRPGEYGVHPTPGRTTGAGWTTPLG